MTQIRISIMAVLLLAITLSTEAGQRRILRHEHPVKDSYIVLINQIEPAAVESVCRDLARTYHITLAKKPDGADSILKYAMQGFSGVAKEEDALDLAEDPRVAAVEQNALLETSGALPPVVDQYNLDRLDDLSAQVDSSDTYVGNHRYDHQTSGRGVYIYIFDSGVERDHTEFDTDNDPSTPNLAPRVKDGVIFANDGHPAYHPCGGIDSSNGYKTGTHGTAVASVAAGRTVGAAPDAYIVPVRVIQCDGVAELQWWCWGMD